MINDSMGYQSMESVIDDIAYLARSLHRIPAFVALTERFRMRSELCESTGVSSSTFRRSLDEFEDSEENRLLSTNHDNTPIRHGGFAVARLDSVTTGSGGECWMRWSQ